MLFAARILAACFVLTVLQAECAVAQQAWSWHGFDFNLADGPKWRATFHARLRTGQPFGSFQQGRTGFVLQRFLTPRFAPIAGYYYGKEEDSTEEFRNFHRLFGGAEAGVFLRPRFSVAARGLYEHFFERTARPATACA